MQNYKQKRYFSLKFWWTVQHGTTDVTRTISFSKKQNVKDIYQGLKGHIAVATTNINKDDTGKKIDRRARKFFKGK